MLRWAATFIRLLVFLPCTTAAWTWYADIPRSRDSAPATAHYLYFPYQVLKWILDGHDRFSVSTRSGVVVAPVLTADNHRIPPHTPTFVVHQLFRSAAIVLSELPSWAPRRYVAATWRRAWLLAYLYLCGCHYLYRYRHACGFADDITLAGPGSAAATFVATDAHWRHQPAVNGLYPGFLLPPFAGIAPSTTHRFAGLPYSACRTAFLPTRHLLL